MNDCDQGKSTENLSLLMADGERVVVSEVHDILLPAANIEEASEHYMITADMPGVKFEDIHIELGKNSLSLKASHVVVNEPDTESLCRERCCGIYTRRFELSGLSVQSAMEIRLEEGVISLKVSKLP